MSAQRVSPRKKKLSLCGKQEKSDETNNKRLKSDTTNSEDKQSSRTQNFMRACLQLSHESFLNIRKRYQVLYLPECKDDVCNHACPVISAAAQQCVQIEVKNGDWCEALEVCLISIMSGRSLSATVLKDVVEIIMNAHEDVNSGYTIDYILKKCQYTLLLNFSSYPPCSQEAVKECYRPFLTSSLDRKDRNEFTNRKQHNSDQGIVAYCFHRLMYELSMESKDDALVDRHNVSNEINDGVQKLHWRKEKLELYEFLDRVERIKRLMLVLESVIDLLQTDLALRQNNKSQFMRSKKPLLAYVLWPDTSVKHGTVSSLCQQIMEVFAYIIHLQYPKEHIQTMSLWMNTVVQMFYLHESSLSLTDYPSPSIHCEKFANQFCNIILPFPKASVLRILEQIQPSFMQHLVGERYISREFQMDENIIVLANKCIKDAVWKDYAAGGSLTVIPKIYRNAKTKPCIFNTLRKTTNGSLTEQTLAQSYPKLDLDMKESNKKVQTIYFVNILFTTLFAYLETYSIREYQKLLEHLNLRNNSERDAYLENSKYIEYKITNPFVKKYRTIISSLKVLFGTLKDKSDEVSEILYELLTNYFS